LSSIADTDLEAAGLPVDRNDQESGAWGGMVEPARVGRTSVGDVVEVPDTASRRGGPNFALVVSKLRPPRLRRGTLPRAIAESLALGEMRPVCRWRPAGFGKTTLLAELASRAERDGRSVAWVSVDERDNDPRILLAYIATALDRVEPVGERVFDALASPAASVSGSVVPRLAAAFAAMTARVVLVLDDVHLLHNRECRSALSVLAEHVPAGSELVLAGREEPSLGSRGCAPRVASSRSVRRSCH
jgi:ATP/maltotriose-dependent transcriptional regulator MalT